MLSRVVRGQKEPVETARGTWGANSIKVGFLVVIIASGVV
jgi:hypothetical protein